GPTMKRFRPVSRGMAHQYFHRTSHITAVIEDRPAPPPAPRAQRRRRRDEPVAAATPKAEETKAEAPVEEHSAEIEEEVSSPPAGHSPPAGTPKTVSAAEAADGGAPEAAESPAEPESEGEET